MGGSVLVFAMIDVEGDGVEEDDVEETVCSFAPSLTKRTFPESKLARRLGF